MGSSEGLSPTLIRERDKMMEVRLQSLELRECAHRIRGVQDVEAAMVDGVLVHRLHIGGGRYLDYPVDEWYMTISSVRRDPNGVK